MIGRHFFISVICFIVGIGSYLLGMNDLSLPEKIIDLKNGEITREELLSTPQLIIVANRDAFEIIEETATVFDFPPDTVLVANISAAPGWVIRAFIKPALTKTAKKIVPRVIYDPDGEWKEGLRFTTEEDDDIAVYYADRDRVERVMEKTIPAKAYKNVVDKQNLGREMVAAWAE